jgi:hypothetical protein
VVSGMKSSTVRRLLRPCGGDHAERLVEREPPALRTSPLDCPR